MPKFHGEIGYAELVETSPGVWKEQITERSYFGDAIRVVGRLENTQNLNPDVVVNNEIQVMADAYAYENFSNIRYVKWMGTRWRITAVQVNRPRLILSIGSVHNG